jgi:zinc transporter ZupT
MLFIVCNSVLPETHASGHGSTGVAFMVGLCLMVFLDTALG